MKKLEVELGEIKLLCPDCGEILTRDICDNYGCKIDMSEIIIDIQPKEILIG